MITVSLLDGRIKATKQEPTASYFWLTDVSFQDGSFEGVIGNEPGVVKNVKLGQKWSIEKAAISDWMFLRDEEMHGNYTLRPLLKTMPKAEADRYRAILAE